IAEQRIPLDYERALHEYFYYDVPHSAYQQYIRTGKPELYIAAHAVARVYREHMVVHEGPRRGRPMAREWENDSNGRIPWAGLRTMYIEGLLDDAQLTGDVRSLDVAREMADAYLADIPRQG